MKLSKQQARIAIINWREFHRAGLHKKRKLFNIHGHFKKTGCMRAEHYVLLNLIRDLPPQRGLSQEAFDGCYWMYIAKSDALEALGAPFGLGGWTLSMLLKDSNGAPPKA